MRLTLAAASAVARRMLERLVPPIATLPTHPLWLYERNLQRMDVNRSRAESIRRDARQPGSARQALARWAGGLQPLRQNDDGALPAPCGRHIAPGPPVQPGQKVATPTTIASNSRADSWMHTAPARSCKRWPRPRQRSPAEAEQIVDFSILADVYKEDPSLV